MNLCSGVSFGLREPADNLKFYYTRRREKLKLWLASNGGARLTTHTLVVQMVGSIVPCFSGVATLLCGTQFALPHFLMEGGKCGDSGDFILHLSARIGALLIYSKMRGRYSIVPPIWIHLTSTPS